MYVENKPNPPYKSQKSKASPTELVSEKNKLTEVKKFECNRLVKKTTQKVLTYRRNGYRAQAH